MVELNINGKAHTVDVDPRMPLLWVLRDVIGMTGTKFGCGIAQCGACTVHLDGRAQRSCIYPVSAVGNAKVVTIEGLGRGGVHPVQQAWIEHAVPQCGYCQSGQIMTAAALIAGKKDISDEEIDNGMTNICRCGTYQRVRAAIHDAVKLQTK